MKEHSYSGTNVVLILKILLLAVFLILCARLVELSVVKGSYFRDLSDNNRIRKIPIFAKRGDIMARGGETLVGNKPITREVTLPQGARETVPGFERVYYLGEAFAHLGGYLGQANEGEVDKVNPTCKDKGPVVSGQNIGRSGLEQSFECNLSGHNGEELVEVDTHGVKIRTLGRKQSIAGEPLRTTIDYQLQSLVPSLFAPTDTKAQPLKGAIVVSDGWGEILALYSSPSFDPTAVGNYVDDPALPLFNRSISGAYHPGSVFKLVTAAAALESGVIDSDYRFTDEGLVQLGTFKYYNWYFTQYGGKEGSIDITRALARSTDTFFYKAGELTGVDALASWAEKFGFGAMSGIDIPGEVAGLVPSPAWKKRVKAESWFLGNTYHFAIGQGDLTATPLQVNLETSVIANGGQLCSPRLLMNTDRHCTPVGVSKANLSIIKAGMIEACKQGGTGYPFFDFSPEVACKTGTAEIDEEGKTHAWFTVFAPADNPQLVVTVLVEEGGEGSKVAAPLAKTVLQHYFSPDKVNDQ